MRIDDNNNHLLSCNSTNSEWGERFGFSQSNRVNRGSKAVFRPPTRKRKRAVTAKQSGVLALQVWGGQA